MSVYIPRSMRLFSTLLAEMGPANRTVQYSNMILHLITRYWQLKIASHGLACICTGTVNNYSNKDTELHDTFEIGNKPGRSFAARQPAASAIKWSLSRSQKSKCSENPPFKRLYIKFRQRAAVKLFPALITNIRNHSWWLLLKILGTDLSLLFQKTWGEGEGVLLVLQPLNQLNKRKILLELPHAVVAHQRLLPVKRALVE